MARYHPLTLRDPMIEPPSADETPGEATNAFLASFAWSIYFVSSMMSSSGYGMKANPNVQQAGWLNSSTSLLMPFLPLYNAPKFKRQTFE